MRRSHLTWVSAALAAMLSLPAGNRALADEEAVTPAAPAEAEQSVEIAKGGDKILHTIPEDGGGDDLFPASSRLVRDLVAVRPKEDLIICIAGCVQGLDRVVYSQPVDPLRKPAVAPVDPYAAEVKPAAAKAPAAAAPAPTSAVEKPSAANQPGETKGHMEPTSTEPAKAEAPQAEAPKADVPKS